MLNFSLQPSHGAPKTASSPNSSRASHRLGLAPTDWVTSVTLLHQSRAGGQDEPRAQAVLFPSHHARTQSYSGPWVALRHLQGFYGIVLDARSLLCC